MKRYDAIKKIVETVDDELIVSNIGFPSRELYGIEDKNETFYMSGSMGMATPIALGLAMALEINDNPRKVIAIDGDGSLLMNFGELVTIYAQNPENLIIALIDNEAYGSTGSQKTYSIGFKEVYYIDARETTADIDMSKYKDIKGPVFIQIKVKPGNSDAPIIPLTPSMIKNRFMNEVQKK